MTDQIYRKLTALLLIFAIGLVPALSYAKSEDNKKDHDNQEERVEKSDRSCFKAFGHLFARGFLKNRGEDRTSTPWNCFLPFGISKKFGGSASTTPDVIPPVISRIRTMVGTSTASVSWRTNENSTSRLYYGTSTGLDVNASTTSYIENNTLKKNHFLILNGLATSSAYYLAIESKDGSGNRTVTTTFTASTTGGL